MSQADDLAAYTFETERMTNGAMLAEKTLVLRSATGQPFCSI